MAFCNSCGSNIPEGVKFCPACGAPAAVSKPVQRPVQQPVYQPVQQPIQPVAAVKQNSARFPVGALIFAILTVGIAVFGFIKRVSEPVGLGYDTLGDLEYILYVLAQFFLLVGICMSKVKGHIITGVSFLIYSFVSSIWFIANYIEYIGSISGFADVVYFLGNLISILMFFFVGLHYVLGGRGVGRPVKVLFTVFYLIIMIIASITAIVSLTSAAISSSGAESYLLSGIVDYLMGILRNIFLCITIFAFNPIRKN